MERFWQILDKILGVFVKMIKKFVYFMVCDDFGNGYGGFATEKEAIESLKKEDLANNYNGKYNQVVKITEFQETVYKNENQSKHPKWMLLCKRVILFPLI